LGVLKSIRYRGLMIRNKSLGRSLLWFIDFHKVPRIDDSRLAELFAREVLGFLVRRELLSPEWADRLLSWRHTGFSVHSRVRAKTKKEAERVG
jgi:hypothetical protein